MLEAPQLKTAAPVGILPQSQSTGRVVVCAREETVRARIEDTLEAAGHAVMTCGASLEHGFSSAALCDAKAVVVACTQREFARAARSRAMRPRWTEIPLVVVATGSWNRAGCAVVRRGAEALVRETELERTLLPSLGGVLADQLCVPESMRDALAMPVLSHREKQVLRLALSGMTNSQIARRLFLSQSTVKCHLSASFRKLQVSSRAEAARRGLDAVLTAA